MGESSPDIAGTSEIKYTGWTKTSTAALQFDWFIKGYRKKTLIKNHLASRLGVSAAGQSPAYQKKRTAKKAI
jgi:hypothetical protein